ncbi:lipopolysaccharide biosynthesis protein [Pontibacter chinhatensis]|uniref:Membrane protein involved in the export of O-antigen and teichoic acid n=1 Tax=Pontibacter chinhatensis TaxID=1436961 RepID=A0A1I2WTJ5_9BACT|nr:lipopolysaccharide biosynthesis protein [Pontibacter chinhatensis]SFH04653.1 Membrane protein involved in the export of O-antigen and teichoic acid [Pontibacter chinhatensis]
MSKNLASKAVSGLKWGTVSTIANAVMQIGYTSAMARLLAPEAFGLVAIAGVVIRFGSYFANMGLTKAIVQKEDLEPQHIRAAFTASAGLGLLFTILTVLLAPLAADFFENPDVTPIVQVMSLAFLISGLSITSVSMLEREMRFKLVSIIEMVAYVLSYLVAGIVLAALGFGVWSLIIATLLQMALSAIGAYVAVRHSVLPQFRLEPYKPLFSYGSRMSFISFLEFLSQEFGTILIGRVLGSHKLGIYNRAYMLVNLPMYMLTRTFSKVVFPSFSKIQNDTEKLGRIYLSSITLLAAIVLPACMGIAVAAPELVRIVLGEQWGESVPVLQVLSLAISLSFITMFAGIVCDAKAILNQKIILNIVFILVIGVLFYLLRAYGLVGFAFAVLIGETVRMALYQRVMHLVLELSYRQQLSIYLPGMLNGILVAVGLYFVSSLLRTADMPAGIIFAAQAVTGAVLLAVLTLLFPHPLLRAELQMILDRFGLNGGGDSPVGRMVQKYRTFILKEA